MNGTAPRAAAAVMLIAACTISSAATAAPAMTTMSAASPAGPVPLLETTCGLASGSVDGDGIASWKGVPYAAPPVKRRRWKKPAPLAGEFCWNGTLDARRYRPACAQYGGPQATTGQEDCLTLNIWAPMHKPATPRPIHVFLYGGDLTQGKTAWYNMSAFASAGQVVAISVNYRLNIFGCLALPELSANDQRGTSGNYAFLDQQESLRWIQANAKAFGGDPHRVQVFGQSSGGTSVLALLASPASRGLFSSAVALSASPNMTMRVSVEEANNRPLVVALGCEKEENIDARYNCLMNKSTAELLAAASTKGVGPYRNHSGIFDEDGLSAFPDCPDHCFGPGLGLAGMPGLPLIDGVTLAAPLTEGLVVDVPVLFQSQAQEPDLGQPPDDDRNMTRAEFLARLRKAFAGFEDVQAEAVLDMYGAQFDEGGAQMAYESVVADLRVICGNRELAMAADRTGEAPAWYSVVTARPSHPVYIFDDWPITYASHLLDLLALLGIVGGAEGEADGGCCTKSSWAECNPLPRCNREAPGPNGASYVEREVDHQNSAALRAVMYELGATGQLKNFPRASEGGVLIEGGTNGSRGVRGLRKNVCEYWLSHGFGPEFWWSD
eukprot:COSAG02_NODE_1415_length_12734_cov_9.846775_1_plen_609_part_00